MKRFAFSPRLAPKARRYSVALLGLGIACSAQDETTGIIVDVSGGSPGVAGSTSQDPSVGGAGTAGGGGASNGGARPTPEPQDPDPTEPTPEPLIWGPPYHAKLPLVPLSEDLHAYLPHRPLGHRVKGSGHTHCSPDHSGISATAQQQRLRDLGGGHAQKFAWMTCHTFVAPEVKVPNFVHMFGAEVYSSKYAGSGAEPHLLAYLPNGNLALGGSAGDRPFGYFKHSINTLVELVREAGGVLAWAHPSRNPLTNAEVDGLRGLWGMEVVSGASTLSSNVSFYDRRLSGGHYTCVTGGGDIHAESDRLTRGYQLVEVPSASPTREEIFDSVASCNFFACYAQSTSIAPLEPVELTVKDGNVDVVTPRVVDSVRFVGTGGKVLHQASNVTNAKYRPKVEDRYVRVEVSDDAGKALCFSQPVWLVPATDPSITPG